MGFSSGINGCGACGGFWKWFKPPHYKFFTSQCNQHDEAYSVGGTKNDRLIADKLLFRQMIELTLCYFGTRKVASQYWYITLALCYYFAVRIFGAKQFNFKVK
ncbi:hypothetical protein [Algoriella sp.]|uniref:hypothetical protein n=1 Tax=Algoriella sp. TaxID=1872434 RepID=UPI002FC7E073